MQQSTEKVYLFRKEEFLTRTSQENVKERKQQSTEKCTSSGKKSRNKKRKIKEGRNKVRKKGASSRKKSTNK